MKDSKMKKPIRKIILRDSCDSQFDDLIVFDKDVDLCDIVLGIEKLKKEKEDYTNEDVYKLLNEICDNYSIQWVGSLPIVEY